MKYMRTLSGIVMCVLLLLLSGSVSVGTEGENLEEIRHVLLLNSYDQRMTWVADIVRGVEEVLQPDKNNLDLHIENMDTKVFHSPEYYRQFFEYLKVKYANIHLSLILSSDNNAFDFLRKYKGVLFPDVPVSFCGVNDFHSNQLEGQNDFTGVAEIFSARKTVDLALSLHPETTELYVINDYLITGRAWSNNIEKDLKGISPKVHIRHSENVSISELMHEISNLPPTALVLFGVYFSDRDGRYYTYEKIGAMLSASSNVPVYCLLEFNIGKGVVGGSVISGLYQGREMAETGLKILNGVAPADIPVKMKGSNRFIFDYIQLERFGINEISLPAESYIINKPYSSYEEYKVQFWVVIVFILTLLATVLFLCINMVKRIRAEAALRDSEERFRQLANASWEAVLIHEKGVLSHANEMFFEMFGYTPEELAGEHIVSVILAKESVGEVQNRIENSLTSSYEAVGRRKNGTTFPIEVHVREVTIQGRDVRMSAIRDLTERKIMEARIAQSEKMEAIGTLAGGIAHDFNNILSAIMGYSELSLSQLEGNEKVRYNIGEVLRAGHRAKDLVLQILTFARKSKEEKRPVQASLIIKEALKLLRASLPSSIEIRNSLYSDSYVLSDTTQIHQIMMNLCTNAGKAMGDGGVLEIELSEVELDSVLITSMHLDVEPGRFLRLTVKDSGVGIPEELQVKIFDPFFTTRSKSQGTGLGLSVVHGIVKDCRGAITVESQVGKGSVFTVYLPIIEPNVDTRATVTDELLPTGNESIMFVDDEPAIVDMAEKVLTNLGYTVSGYTSSSEALLAFARNSDKYDLVITDMTMPHMNGDRFARELLSLKADIPIIICTGFSEQITEEEALKIGISSYIMKPVVMKTLAITVRNALGKI